MIEVRLGAVRVQLLGDRAAFRPDLGELLVSDVHLGKAATFRRAGRPLPRGTTRTDLDRLDRLLAVTGATRLTVLGDLVHAALDRDGSTLEQLAGWLDARARLRPRLVLGNHDRHAAAALTDLPLELSAEGLDAAGVAYFHAPPAGPAGPWIAGHLHPSFVLEAGADRLRTPVFWRTARGGLVLPAFGAFTGTSDVRPRRGDRLFAAGDAAVVPVPAGGWNAVRDPLG